MSDDTEEWATSAEYRALQKAIAENEKQELDIRTRMDKLAERQAAHRAAGRALDEQYDALLKELRENGAKYRELRFKLSQSE